MSRVSNKVISLIIAGVIVIGVIISANVLLKKYFNLNKQIFYHLNFLQKEEHKLNFHILQSSICMYFNNDLIVDDIREIQKEIDYFTHNKFFKSHFPNAYKEFEKYQRAINKKVNLIYEFQEFNMPIKNSMIFLATLLKKMPYAIESKPYHKTAVSLVSDIFLAKQTKDMGLLQDEKVKKLNSFKLNPNELEFHKMFMEHINLFYKYLPKYKKYLQSVIHMDTLSLLQNVFESYNQTTKKDIKLFEILSYLLIVFIIALISYLIYTINALERRVDEIEYMMYHDSLTKLYNRTKFNEDKQNVKNPALILFNIDKFKYINDFYGVKCGDYVLEFIAKSLSM